MDGKYFFALSSICLFLWNYKVAGIPLQHPVMQGLVSFDYRLVREPSTNGTEEQPNYIESPLPTRSAAKDELKKFRGFVEASIRKSHLTFNGMLKASDIQVDEMIAAVIQRAMLPHRFVTVVEFIFAKFLGYFPNNSKNMMECHVYFELVKVLKEPEVVSRPTRFKCRLRKPETTTLPTPKAATPTVEVTTKPTGKTDPRPKDQIKSKRSSHSKIGYADNHVVKNIISTRNPFTEEDAMKIMHRNKDFNNYDQSSW